MSNELEIFSKNNLSDEERKALDLTIDEYIDNMEGNRKELNRLVFECTAAMTQADDIGNSLKNKKGISRLIGSISGSNKALQDKINQERANAQYASQRCLQKLAERNVMTFDLITAVNNKLNASLFKVHSEFKEVYDAMGQFYKKNRNELVRLESRLDKVERNVKLLNWQNSIEYQDFNGIEYIDLTPIEKIVCLARDFYDITDGNWSTSDLLLLKTAMSTIDISPKARVNYGQALNLITSNRTLKAKLLGQENFGIIDYPEYMISFSGMQMLDSLSSSSKYVIDTIKGYMEENNVEADKQMISQIVANKYLANVAQVDVNIEIECFDLLLDLLYNLGNSAEGVINIEACEISGNRIAKTRSLSSQSPLDIKGSLLDHHDQLVDMANNGNARAMYLLSVLYSSYKINHKEAAKWLIKANEAGDSLAIYEYRNKNGDKLFGDCIGKIIQMADNNDAYACATLADIYGSDKKDFDKAVKYYQKAADLGNAYAMSRLGDLYLHGSSDVLPVNPEKACELYKASAQLGYVNAMKTMCDKYLYGDNRILHDSNEYIIWLKKAAEAGDIKSMIRLAKEYQKGENIGKNLMNFKKWLLKAVDLGSKDAYYYLGKQQEDEGDIYSAIKYYEAGEEWNLLGNLFLVGKKVPKDNEKGIYYYEKAIADGNISAMKDLGELFLKGENWYGAQLPTNIPKGIMYMEMAANNGDSGAMKDLGEYYIDGDYIPRDIQKGIFWYEKAIENNEFFAAGKLAEMYLEGDKIPQNIQRAFELYQQDANSENLGRASSMVALAKMYRSGIKDNYGHTIIGQNPKMALEWLTKATDENDNDAMEMLGDMYYNGEGVEKDTGRAFQWYEKAVEKAIDLYGHADSAEYKLGRCYFYGEGTLQSYWKAVSHLKEAADNCFFDEYGVLASYLLGICYYSEGAQQDLDKAVEYLNQAAGNWQYPQHDAYYYLGLCYLESGKQQNLTEAVNCFMQAAEAKCEHSQDAMYELSICYAKGLGVQKDIKNAEYWCDRSGKGLLAKCALFSSFLTDVEKC